MKIKEIWRMNNLNSILVEGNLVRDVELKTTPNGLKVCNFVIASNRYYKKDDALEHDVSFFEVETWSTLAEACGRKGKKGRGIRVVGRLKQSRWVGADGKNRSKIYIVAEHVEFRPMSKEDLVGEQVVEDQSEEFIDEEAPIDERDMPVQVED